MKHSMFAGGAAALVAVFSTAGGPSQEQIALEAQVEELESRLEAANAESGKLEAEIAGLREQNVSLEAKLAAGGEARVARDAELAALREKYESAARVRHSLGARLSIVQEQVFRLESTLQSERRMRNL